MAADPGSSSDTSSPYHLFLTRIPPKLPKEEVEAALSAELAARRVKVLSISVVPQSAWKNKGFGFVILAGSPDEKQISSIAAQLDNDVRVGGKALNVRVCEAPVSGGKPAVTNGPLNSWDQPPEKIARLCAQVLHCYFARRAHQQAYKAEKLLALLSETVAPSCNQEPKPVSLWGRDVYGSLEKMFLAFGEVHFGGSWTLTGTIADRNAVLTVGKARHMQGWDALRDPLPIATLLRLAACKQRLEDIHTPEASSGFSTPTVCRRCSDCGSLSAVHSTEQPSCSQSEASWSLRSIYVAAASSSTTEATSSSDTSPSLGTPSNGSEPPGGLSSSSSNSNSATSTSWDDSLKCLEPGGRGEAVDTGQLSQQEPRPPDLAAAAAGASVAASGGGGGGGAVRPPLPPAAAPVKAPLPSAAADRLDEASSSDRQQQQQEGMQTGGGAGQLRQQPVSRGPLSRQQPRAAAATTAVVQHPSQAQQQLQSAQQIPCGLRSAQPLACRPTALPLAHPHKSISALMPTAQDLLSRCANHLKLLFSRNPGQDTFLLTDICKLLSEAPDVLAWGSGSPYFTLEGYAHAVYGSFERFLLEISRAYFGGSWYFEGGHRPGELRVMCLAFGLRSACSTPGLAGARAKGFPAVKASAPTAGSRRAAAGVGNGGGGKGGAQKQQQQQQQQQLQLQLHAQPIQQHPHQQQQ